MMDKKSLQKSASPLFVWKKQDETETLLGCQHMDSATAGSSASLSVGVKKAGILPPLNLMLSPVHLPATLFFLRGLCIHDSKPCPSEE
jgi:hypothetical protein